jgi:hypothetical protein
MNMYLTWQCSPKVLVVTVKATPAVDACKIQDSYGLITAEFPPGRLSLVIAFVFTTIRMYTRGRKMPTIRESSEL